MPPSSMSPFNKCPLVSTALAQPEIVSLRLFDHDPQEEINVTDTIILYTHTQLTNEVN